MQRRLRVQLDDLGGIIRDAASLFAAETKFQSRRSVNGPEALDDIMADIGRLAQG